MDLNSDPRTNAVLTMEPQGQSMEIQILSWINGRDNHRDRSSKGRVNLELSTPTKSRATTLHALLDYKHKEYWNMQSSTRPF